MCFNMLHKCIYLAHIFAICRVERDLHRDIRETLPGLTESFLADDGVTGLARFTLASLVEGLDAEGVLLLLHQSLQLVLSLRNVLRNADPLLASGLLEFDDVAFDLGPAVVLRSGPC